MKIAVNMQLGKLVKGFEDLSRRQASFAVAASLTATAKDVQAESTDLIKSVFDRPTPATVNSLYVRPATKTNLEAVVGIKEYMSRSIPAVKWLAAEIEGGPRRTKRFEKALQAAGILPQGYMVVPGGGADLDEYGNIRQSMIVRLLSYFQAFPAMGYRANMSDKRKTALAKGIKGQQGVAYFVSTGQRLHAGVWARHGSGKNSAIKPVLLFVRIASYETRFDYFAKAERTIARRFPENLKQIWEKTWIDAWIRANV